MLAKLPPEVLMTITSYLSFKDKLSLIKTCRKLNQVISEWNLYEELSIPAKAHGIDKTRDIVRMFKNKTFNGAQVKRLELDLRRLSNQLYRRLPIIFPNVTELINATHEESARNDFILEPLTKWKDTLERYDMQISYGLEIVKLFSRCTFSRLMYLNLTPGLRGNRLKVTDIIKNMPLLKQLRLYQIVIEGFTLFETLRKHCNHLESLVLSLAAIVINDISLPASLEPIQSLKTLRFEGKNVVCDNNFVFLDYISKKCPSLTTLDLFYGFEMSLANVFNPTFDGMVLTVGFQNEIPVHRRNLIKTHRLYKDGGANRFLSQLPTTLTSLGLCTGLFTDLLDHLYNAHLLDSLTSLKLLDEHNRPSFLFQNELHFEYFYRMTSLVELTAGISVDIKDYDDNMNVLTSIRKVNLSIHTSTATDTSNFIEMEWLLSTFPNVESFTIEQSDVQIVTEGLIKTRTYPTVKSVYFKNGNLDERFLFFLRRLTPNLKHLSYTIQGKSYQYKIPWTYYRDKKLAYQEGKPLTGVDNIPEQTSFYIDLKGYQLESFQLISNLSVSLGLGDANVVVEIVKPSRSERHIYRLNPNGKPIYMYRGEGVKPYKLREMTKVMLACTRLNTFQFDNTKVINI